MNVNFATKKDLTDYLTKLFQPHATALQGIIDKLPESMRPDFLRLKKDMDDQLSKLAPTDQVPAAMDASYALQGFCHAMERMSQYVSDLTGRLAQIAKDHSDTASAYQGMQKQLKDGDLLTKAAATELCGTARQQALDSMKPTLLGMRKQQIELAKLPLPAEELLSLPEAEFAPQFEAAKANVATCLARGLKLDGRGAGLIKELAWLKPEAFQGKLTAFEDVLGKAPEADPLLGAPVGAAKTAATEKSRMVW
jgi:hypothetical protein